MDGLVLSSPNLTLTLLLTCGSHMLAISSTFLIWKTKHVPSACQNRLHLTAIGISLTNILKHEGPKIDPCGTPHEKLEISKKQFSKFTVNLRLDG